ncbi:MAG: hypothetical protein QNJ78_05955, partial [Gammaproteobacteria bacterium]|nr:hypothetical protein [Gammaproteobacteria bacterium]
CVAAGERFQNQTNGNERELIESTARWYGKQFMCKPGVKSPAELNTKLMNDIAFMVNLLATEPVN